MTDCAMLEKLESHVQAELMGEASGHDWWHIVRVRHMAVIIAEKEGADLFICQAAALVHDLADEKFNPSAQAGLDKVAQLLHQIGLDGVRQRHILEIIADMSFRDGQGAPMRTLEGRVVQDADRLDALGAIGIARTMAYSGYTGRPIHMPDCQAGSWFAQDGETAIGHFYQKLLKLKDLMNTPYAKCLAEARHAFMVAYLAQFEAEWQASDS